MILRQQLVEGLRDAGERRFRDDRVAVAGDGADGHGQRVERLDHLPQLVTIPAVDVRRAWRRRLLSLAARAAQERSTEGCQAQHQEEGTDARRLHRQSPPPRLPPLLNHDRSRHVRMKLAEVPELARLREDLAEAGSGRDGPGLQHVAILAGRRVRHLILVRPGDRVAGGDLDQVGAVGEVANIDGDLRGGRGLGALGGVRRRFRGAAVAGASVAAGAASVAASCSASAPVPSSPGRPSRPFRRHRPRGRQPMVARVVELAQTNDQIAVDDATADIAAGDVVLDRLRALMDVDRVRSGQDVTEGQRDVGLALFDQDGGRGAEGPRRRSAP